MDLDGAPFELSVMQSIGLAPKITRATLSLPDTLQRPRDRLRDARHAFTSLRELHLSVLSRDDALNTGVAQELGQWQTARVLSLKTMASCEGVTEMLRALQQMTQLVELNVNVQAPAEYDEDEVQMQLGVSRMLPNHAALRRVELTIDRTYRFEHTEEYAIAMRSLIEKTRSILDHRFQGKLQFTSRSTHDYICFSSVQL